MENVILQVLASCAGPIVYPLHHIVFFKVKNDLQFGSNFSIQIAT